MRTSKFTESQMMAALKQAEAGMSVNDISRQLGISPATFYKWRAKYGGLEASELSRLRELEEENRRLKQLYADLSLRAHGMEVLLAKKF
ncbi:MAG: transposase [Gammaproteobacteria bacterium]